MKKYSYLFYDESSKDGEKIIKETLKNILGEEFENLISKVLESKFEEELENNSTIQIQVSNQVPEVIVEIEEIQGEQVENQPKRSKK